MPKGHGYSATNFNTLVVNPQGERTTWQYDAAWRVRAQLLANGVRVSMAYDNADRLIRLANLTSTGTTITSYVDTWDGADNRLSRVEQDGTRVTWSYDATYQLTREHRNGANSYDTTYAYDPAGNRRLKLDNSVRTTYSYDAANQLQKYVDSSGTTTFSFDASGNQRLQIASSGGGTTTNTWDYENRLTKVALPSGVLNTFTYNGNGLRVQRQDSSGTSKQIWDGQKIVEETDQNNVVQVVYTQSPRIYGNLVSQRRLGMANYFLFDPLGSVNRLTDGSQDSTDTYLFKAFGELLVASGTSANVFRYLGIAGYYWSNDLQRYMLRARWLPVGVGRMVSLDPGGNRTRGGGYAYALNNPLVYIDPNGAEPQPPEKPKPILGITIGVYDQNLAGAKCGGPPAGIRWQFALTDRSKLPCEGYFIQKVEIFCDIGSCKKCPKTCPTKPPDKPACTFYEAFHVQRGAAPADGTLVHLWTDRSFVAVDNGTCGAVRHKGTIKFFCKDAGEYPDGPGTGDLGTEDRPPTVPGWGQNKSHKCGMCTINVGGPASIDEKDAGNFIRNVWDKTPGAGPMERWFRCVWDCCQPGNEVDADASPKGGADEEGGDPSTPR